ncbi:Wzz/FepE/Etk N-terminal domain-containing protein [Prochlorococcus marinus]|uniref:Polysaccharide chain length determinant N-terminal domain-containing protein n=1 Tax=Prochlorococcus marinus str. GP2 TaxID=59925 RepID=A0A0A1ZDX7_PROMR|nr:Wzz/FepE/Etk N-terminal domain-containing protein [Prochlorococcus marinus]KGF86478.1 hypothetical protein EU91_1240 [Prochlorococcus marinus str. GP2]
MNQNEYNFNSNNEYFDKSINLVSIFNALKRGKKIFFLLIILSTIFSIGTYKYQKPIYKGNLTFRIVEKNNFGEILFFGDQGQILKLNSYKNINKPTFKKILTSKDLLYPVFESSKQIYKKKGMETPIFNNWINKINLDYIGQSDVLSISFKGENKEIILKNLDLISQAYKDYADSNKIISKKLLNFLIEEKKEFEKEYQKNLNEYSSKTNNKLSEISIINDVLERNKKTLEYFDEQILKAKLLADFKINSPTFEIMSYPYISEKLSPIFIKSLIISLIIALLASTIIVYIKENMDGYIFEIDDLKQLIKCDFIDTLILKNKKITIMTINKLFTNIKDDSYKKYSDEFNGLILMSKNFNLDFLLDKNYSSYLDSKLISLRFDEELKVDKCKNIILLIQPGSVTKKDIFLINQYLYLYEEKIIGWIQLKKSF